MTVAEEVGLEGANAFDGSLDRRIRSTSTARRTGS
jgi:hypothetical protein